MKPLCLKKYPNSILFKMSICNSTAYFLLLINFWLWNQISSDAEFSKFKFKNQYKIWITPSFESKVCYCSPDTLGVCWVTTHTNRQTHHIALQPIRCQFQRLSEKIIGSTKIQLLWSISSLKAYIFLLFLATPKSCIKLLLYFCW